MSKCSPCEQARRDRERKAQEQQAALAAGITINMTPITEGCGYSISQLTKWKNALDCGYTQNILESVNITPQLYSQYINVLNHTIDNINSTCIYANELNTILNATHVLVALGC